jgi:hypothetical protein
MALLCLFLRALRPTRGLHAAPRCLRRELRAEARTRRANRVRRYAIDVPTVAETESTPDTPRIPSPRRSPQRSLPEALRPVPADYVPVVDPSAVAVPASIVRGYYRAHEARQERARVDRDRLGVAVLMDLGVSA